MSVEPTVIEKSSANAIEPGILLRTSSTYKMKRIGPEIDPCKTPQFTENIDPSSSDLSPSLLEKSIASTNFLSLRKLAKKLTVSD